jgi:hypothetical protein
MPRRSKLLAFAAAAALAPAFAFAEQTPQAQPEQPLYAQEAAAEPANTLSLNGAFTNTLTTAYITRGVLLENQGIIYQNVGELYFKLLDEPDAGVSKVTAIVGMFNSVHDEATDAGLSEVDPDTGESAFRTSVTKWYEFDWWAGASFDFATDFNVSLLYQEFHSPNGGFGSCKNVQAKLSYNDSKLWGDSGFALKPYGIAFLELDGKAGTGSDEGLYVELGLGPSFALTKTESYPLTLTIPVSVGLGFSDFYEDDDLFGYVSGGVVVSAPLSFVPAQYGAWTASVGGYYYYYGEGVDGFNAANDSSDSDGIFVGTVGLGLSF